LEPLLFCLGDDQFQTSCNIILNPVGSTH
jgi:hypothetical protein